jgi:phage gp36-like protein
MYARLSDLYARYGEEEINQVADTDGTGTPAPELIRRVLADAQSEIDAALAARYQLPLCRPPALIVKIACALAREALYNDAPPKEVKEQAKWAREMLRAIAEGILRFGDLDPAAGDGLTEARVIPERKKMRWPGGQRTEDR